MSDVEKIVVALQGNPVKREILGAGQDGYVLTWTNASNEWESAPNAALQHTAPVPIDITAGGTFNLTSAQLSNKNIVLTSSSSITSNVTIVFGGTVGSWQIDYVGTSWDSGINVTLTNGAGSFTTTTAVTGQLLPPFTLLTVVCNSITTIAIG